MIPQTKTWADLGFPGADETRVDLEAGPDIFARLDAADQRAILGPSKFQAYTDGRVALQDLVAVTHSSRWGRGRRERSLSDALAA